MNEPELHYATDRRCYNGAFCSDLQREINSREELEKQIKAVHPEFRCTYFPAEGKHMAFVFEYKTLTNVMFADRGQCLLQAWRILVGQTELGYCRLEG